VSCDHKEAKITLVSFRQSDRNREVLMPLYKVLANYHLKYWIQFMFKNVKFKLE